MYYKCVYFLPIRMFARSSNLASTTPNACLAIPTKSTSVYVHQDLQEKIVKKGKVYSAHLVSNNLPLHL